MVPVSYRRIPPVGGPVKIIGGPDLQTGRSIRIGWGGWSESEPALFGGPLATIAGPPALFVWGAGPFHRAPYRFTPGPPVL